MENSKSVVIIGLDAAADLTKFGYVICKIKDRSEPSVSEYCESGVLNEIERVIEIFQNHISRSANTILAIDAPLGWPQAFSKAVSQHDAGRLLNQMDRDDFFKRKTDQLIRQRYSINPLEVSADKIARASFTALSVLDQFRRLCTDGVLELAWKHQDLPHVSAIEVYPAASLAAWGLPHRKYKGSENVSTAREIASALETRANWISRLLPDENDRRGDIFDAGLCAIAAIDFILGHAVKPPDEDKQRVLKEGWIWVKRHQIAG